MCTEPARAPLTDASWEELPVEHLQFGPRVTEALLNRGISTVGKALSFADSSTAFQFPYAPQLFESARQAADCRRPGGFDWRRYWALRGNQFHHLAAALPEFDRLAEGLWWYAVDRRSLGNAGAMLQASEVRSFPLLIAGLRKGLGPVRGIGRIKIAELVERLFWLAERLESGRLPALNPRPDSGDDADEALALSPRPLTEPLHPPPPKLSDDVRRLPVSVLQLGVKSRLLEDAGYRSVGDLADADPEILKRLPIIGARTVGAITEKLLSLEVASASGQMDWQIYSSQSGLPLIPPDPLASASDMLGLLPQIFQQIAPHLKDDSYRAVLFQRLTRGPGGQRTLDELGQLARPPVTRERIRQKEKKLLWQLAGALIWDVDGRLGIQFHPTMLGFWRLAAAEFEGVDEIRFDEFVVRLAAVWQVERQALIRELPFIVAVVTGDPQLPASFRAGARIDPVLFGLRPETSAIPLSQLRIGRLRDRLGSRGITTLGALVDAAADGLTNADIDSVLTNAAAAVQADGSFDWKHFALASSLEAYPPSSPQDASAFVSGFCDTAYFLLSRLHASDRRPTIFRLRTCRPVRSRPTLDSVSHTLRTHGPTIKREESLLLEELHDIIVDRDFSSLPVWLDTSWLRYTRQAHSIFIDSGSDYVVFLSRLADAWSVNLETTEQASPALWAIFSGYPEGRKRPTRGTGKTADIALVAPARIRLRGFQRLH